MVGMWLLIKWIAKIYDKVPVERQKVWSKKILATYWKWLYIYIKKRKKGFGVGECLNISTRCMARTHKEIGGTSIHLLPYWKKKKKRKSLWIFCTSHKAIQNELQIKVSSYFFLYHRLWLLLLLLINGLILWLSSIFWILKAICILGFSVQRLDFETVISKWNKENDCIYLAFIKENVNIVHEPGKKMSTQLGVWKVIMSFISMTYESTNQGEELQERTMIDPDRRKSRI